MKHSRSILLILTLVVTLSSTVYAGNIGGLRTNASGNIGGLRTNATGNIGGLRTNSTQGNADLEILFYANIAGLIRALLATSALV